MRKRKRERNRKKRNLRQLIAMTARWRLCSLRSIPSCALVYSLYWTKS
jgi:hypothetical protein